MKKRSSPVDATAPPKQETADSSPYELARKMGLIGAFVGSPALSEKVAREVRRKLRSPADSVRDLKGIVPKRSTPATLEDMDRAIGTTVAGRDKASRR